MIISMRRYVLWNDFFYLQDVVEVKKKSHDKFGHIFAQDCKNLKFWLARLIMLIAHTLLNEFFSYLSQVIQVTEICCRWVVPVCDHLVWVNPHVAVLCCRWTSQCSRCVPTRSTTFWSSSWTTTAMCCASTATGTTQTTCLVTHARWCSTISWPMTPLRSEKSSHPTLAVTPRPCSCGGHWCLRIWLHYCSPERPQIARCSTCSDQLVMVAVTSSTVLRWGNKQVCVCDYCRQVLCTRSTTISLWLL